MVLPDMTTHGNYYIHTGDGLHTSNCTLERISKSLYIAEKRKYFFFFMKDCCKIWILSSVHFDKANQNMFADCITSILFMYYKINCMDIHLLQSHLKCHEYGVPEIIQRIEMGECLSVWTLMCCPIMSVAVMLHVQENCIQT